MARPTIRGEHVSLQGPHRVPGPRPPLLRTLPFATCPRFAGERRIHGPNSGMLSPPDLGFCPAVFVAAGGGRVPPVRPAPVPARRPGERLVIQLLGNFPGCARGPVRGPAPRPDPVRPTPAPSGENRKSPFCPAAGLALAWVSRGRPWNSTMGVDHPTVGVVPPPRSPSSKPDAEQSRCALDPDSQAPLLTKRRRVDRDHRPMSQFGWAGPWAGVTLLEFAPCHGGREVARRSRVSHQPAPPPRHNYHYQYAAVPAAGTARRWLSALGVSTGKRSGRGAALARDQWAGPRSMDFLFAQWPAEYRPRPSSAGQRWPLMQLIFPVTKRFQHG